MKNLIISILLMLPMIANAQIHWLVNKDSIADCSMIKVGKFINKETPEKATPGYYIVMKDGFATEYIENGKFYIKSRLEFESPCKYKSIVIENTIPNHPIQKGDVIYTEIMESATIDRLLLIRSKMTGDWQTLVLEKTE